MDLEKLGVQNKKKFFLILFNVLVLLYLDFRLFISPRMKDIVKLVPKVKRFSQDITSVKKDIKLFDELITKYNNTKAKSALYSKKVVSEDQITALLEQISKIAKAQEIKIMQIKAVRDRTIKPVAEIGEDKYYTLPISLDLRSGYHALGVFLNKLENLDIFMRITSFDISPNPSDYFRHQIKLNLETYLLVKGK